MPELPTLRRIRPAFLSASAAGPWLPGLLFLLTVAVFWPATGNDFIWYDDDFYVTANVWVREGLSPAGIHWAFTTFHEANWHPLTWISHMLDVSLFGLNPFGHHLVSVLIHALNTALLFLFLLRASGAAWRSALASALFALHPLHVESVAWVAERKDVLSVFFWMLSMIAYASYARKPGARRYLALLACFVLGLLSKPMILTLPFVLLLMDFWPFGRWGSAAAARAGSPAGRSSLRVQLIREKIPLFVLAGISVLVTLHAQKTGGTVGTFEEYPLAVRITNALAAYVSYLGTTLWPRDLAVIYPHPRALPPLWQVLSSLALLAGISLAAFKSVRRWPCLAVGWLWFLGTLVPVIGLVQVGLQARADRYTYLPLVGIFIALSWGGADVLRRRGSVLLSLGVATVILSSLVWATRSQIAWWRNDSSLLEHAIEVTENNWVAHLTLAVNLEKQGRSVEAQEHYDAMKRIKHDFVMAHASKGIQLSGAESGEQVDQAHGGEARPDRARESYLSGNELVRQGRHREAVGHYDAALRLAPRDAQAHNNLGVALAGLGDHGGAAAEFREAIRLRPEAAEPHVNLGNILALQQNLEGAASSYRRAIKLHPESVEARLNLADLLLAQGRRYRALFEYREALLLEPYHEEARRRLERARNSGRAPSPVIAGQAADSTNFLLFF